MIAEPRDVCAHATKPEPESPCPFCRAAAAAETHQGELRDLGNEVGRDAILVFIASLPKAA